MAAPINPTAATPVATVVAILIAATQISTAAASYTTTASCATTFVAIFVGLPVALVLTTIFLLSSAATETRCNNQNQSKQSIRVALGLALCASVVP